MPGLPSGTVTFLFTDIEGSTAQWERDRETMREAVARQLAILQSLIAAHHGVLYKTVGDGTQSAFGSAEDALRAAIAAQRALLAEAWTDSPNPLRVRMALHAGEAEPDAHGDYLAPALNRLSRVLAVGYGGQILLSQAVQQLARGGLPPGTEMRDLREHRLRDLLEPERVYQLLHPDLPQDFPPLKSLDARPNNLPRQPTPFLGREAQVQEIVALLQREDVQLLTLTGPGGTGKTRLALQAAAELPDAFADGIYFVPLAPLTDPAHVPNAIAQALGVREEGEQSLQDRLRHYLAPKEMLLVIDNWEHLIDAAPLVGSLLEGAPRLKMLATSRIPLRVRAEREYPVPPLGLPRRKPPPTMEQLSQYEAVRLFIERAQAVKPDFAIDNETAPAVAEICHRLDGLPLAIELAAARVRMLSPTALLGRLEKRLPLLTGGARDAPARQHTLRATITWSYDLLEPDEQRLFRRLAVFASGCSLDAAEIVGNHDSDFDTFAGLEELVEHSLLRHVDDASGEPRFVMLETIREFGAERLAESGEEADVRGRHAQHFLTLAETAFAQFLANDHSTWPDRLEVEHPNLRAALQHARDTHDGVVLARLAGALGPYWSSRTHLREATQWLEHALAVDAPPTVRLRCLMHATWLAHQLGRDGWEIELAEEALALAEHIGSAKEIAETHYILGHALFTAGDPARSQELLTAALAWFRSAGDTPYAVDTLLRLAVLATLQGNFDGGRALGTEALEMARLHGDPQSIADCLYELGYFAIDEGDGDRALALIEEAVGLVQHKGNTFQLGLFTSNLGVLQAEHRGDDVRAEPLLMETLNFWHDAGNRESTAFCLNSLGRLARRRGDLGLAETRHRDALALSTANDDAIMKAVGTVRAQLGLAQVACARGEMTRAAHFFRMSLEHLATVAPEEWHRQGSIRPILRVAAADCLRLAASTAARGPSAARAARVLGAAAACQTASFRGMLRAEGIRAEEGTASVRAQMSEASFTEAWNAGQALSVQEAIAEARILVGGITDSSD